MDAEKGSTPAEPDLGKTERALNTVQLRSIGITLLVVLAALYTLYFARAFFLPVVIALLLTFLLNPVVRALGRIRIPPPIGAGLVIVGFLGAVGVGAYELAEPAQRWIAKAPQTLSGVNDKLRAIRQPVEQVTRTAEEIESATRITGPGRTQEVLVKGPSLISRIFGTTQTLLGGILEIVFLLYFLLASGDLFLQKLVKVLPQLRDKKKAVQIARDTESSISAYLSTVALVNIGEGLVVTGALWLLDMPTPGLWGVLAAFLEFIPYLGAATMFGILTLVALTTFDSVGHALLVPASFLAINLVQANLVSPLLLGRRLALNPVAIFVGLAFWWWLWGLPGAFIAVPLLATIKIFCDHIEALAPFGEFLGK